MRLKDFCLLLEENPFSRSVRQAFEFRHPTWSCREVYRLLDKHKMAFCIAHSNRWPCGGKVTADFVYLRFHGGEVLYGSSYSKKELADWADKIKKWQDNKLDVFAYFNNDVNGYAVKNAKSLLELIEK